MLPSVRAYFQHILDEIRYVQHSAHGLDKIAFLQDETRKRAYVRSIEIIGEAIKQIPIQYAKNILRLNGGQWLECVIGSFMAILGSIMR